MFGCCRASAKGAPKKAKKGKHDADDDDNIGEQGDETPVAATEIAAPPSTATTTSANGGGGKESNGTSGDGDGASAANAICTNGGTKSAQKGPVEDKNEEKQQSKAIAVDEQDEEGVNGLRNGDREARDAVERRPTEGGGSEASATAVGVADAGANNAGGPPLQPLETTTTTKPTTIMPSEDAANQTADAPHATNASVQQAAPLPTTPTPTTAVVAPKSCLSRHNSTHMSIKKKVNISTRAEIIEPPDDDESSQQLLPPPPLSRSQGSSPLRLGGGMVGVAAAAGVEFAAAASAAAACDDADEDDVFSDSLPPPKRESMCAPYIGRDELPDEPLASLAFTHGLPEWFSDERVAEIGCIEPPVTPVGRDELEMRHQRLYAQLLRAAQAAVCYGVGAEPIFSYEGVATASDGARGRAAGDCDPDLKPSVAENLEHLVTRLERLVERLERSVSARDLELANRTLGDIVAKKRDSVVDLETGATATTHHHPPAQRTAADEPQAEHICARIERVESSLSRLNERHSSRSGSNSASASHSQPLPEPPPLTKQLAGSLEDIPTVVDEYQEHEHEEEEEYSLPPPPTPPPPSSMSVLGYQDIMAGPLAQYLSLSAKIGGDVAKHAGLVKAAFDAQLQYVTLATQIGQPGKDKQAELLQPTSAQISAIQDYREKNRTSPFFNHLSAISESIPALGWVCVSPTPGPHVKEMNDAGQFYTNRVLKEWKEKDVAHVEWARAWIKTLTELQAFIKQYHTTGLVWSGKGGAPPPPPIGACPPPPPPPSFDLAAMALDDGGDERSALFAQINQGEGITRNLKKVTSEMQTHKNPTLRSGPAPFKSPVGASAGVSGGGGAGAPKEPVFNRDGKKWLIEYQKNNAGLVVDGAEMNNVVYVFRCEGSTLTVKGKVNNIVLDSCKKCSLLFDSVVASVEFVNCQSVQMQVLGFVPTISIDKTDGCQMYLSKESLGVEIVNSKSSEMNVLLPEASGDFTELAVPEQYKTTISGKSLKTVCVDSLG